MRSHIVRTRAVVRLLLAGCVSLLASAAAGQSATGLVGPYWKAIELAGKPTAVQDASREAHLQFQADGRVSGADGCNSIAGSYTLKGDAVTFGQMVGTQMACANTAGTERTFRDAVQGTRRWRIVGDRLELSNDGDTRLVVFAVRIQTPGQASSMPLAGNVVAARQISGW